MKKYARIVCIILLPMVIIPSYKKSNTIDRKDYTAFIKDKTWIGAITYAGKTTEYYAVHFNADNTLEWFQLSGTYIGHWIINDSVLTLTFDGNTVEIKAVISDDNQFINISDNTSIYEINSGGMVVNPAIPLDNTIWKGTRSNTTNGTQVAWQMSFLPDNKVEIKWQTTILGTFSYSRSAAGAAIRVAGGYFAVLMQPGEMKGSDANPAYPWQVFKQEIKLKENQKTKAG